MEFYTELKHGVRVGGLSRKENLSDMDIDCTPTKCIINWELDFNDVISGLDSIRINIKRVYIEYTWDVPKEYVTFEEQQELLKIGGKETELSIVGKGVFDTNSEKEFKIEKQIEFKTNGECFIHRCEVYLDENLIYLGS